jgi:hemerythrin-like domain-containing protein
MDATSVIVENHAHVERLLRAYDDAEGSHRLQAERLDAVADALAAHAAVEAELLFPAVQAETGRLDREIERELEQHNLMNLLLVELDAMLPADRGYDAKVRVLAQVFEQHVHDQEAQVLPELRRRLDAAARERLGAELLERTDRLEHPREPAWSLRAVAR